jgi:hypothetical protein
MPAGHQHPSKTGLRFYLKVPGSSGASRGDETPQIGAGAKGAVSAAGQYGTADVIVFTDLLPGRRQLDNGIGIDGVVSFGPVEGNAGNMVFYQ